MAKPPPIGTIAYEVKSTDTLTSIALRFNITPNELTHLNRICSQWIYPGQTLFVPDNSEKKSVPPVSSSASTPCSDAPLLRRGDNRATSPPLWPSEDASPRRDIRLVVKSTLSGDSDLEELLGRDGLHGTSDEISEKYLKINCKYVTDGQGVVSGVLLITPLTLMFNPSVDDHLVIDRGEDYYLIKTPLQSISSLIFYDDIAAMVLGDNEKEYVPTSKRSSEASWRERRHPGHIVRRGTGEVYEVGTPCGSASPPRQFTGSITPPRANIMSRSESEADDHPLTRLDQDHCEEDISDLAKESSETLVNSCESFSPNQASTTLSNTATGIVMRGQDVAKADCDTADDTGVDVKTNLYTASQLNKAKDHMIETRGLQVETTGRQVEIAGRQVETTFEDSGIGSSSLDQRLITSEDSMLRGAEVCGKDPHRGVAAEFESVRDCSFMGELHYSSSTPRKMMTDGTTQVDDSITECPDYSDTGVFTSERVSQPTASEQSSEPASECPYSGDLCCVMKESDILMRAIDTSLKTIEQNIHESSQSSSTDPPHNTFVHPLMEESSNQISRLNESTNQRGDSGAPMMSLELDDLTRYSSTVCDSTLSSTGPLSPRSTLSEEAKLWLGERGIRLSSMYDSQEITDDDDTGALDLSTPRPASQLEDQFMYVAVKVHKSYWTPMRMRQVAAMGIPPNRDQKRRQHWFAIPKERVDHLYSFISTWNSDFDGMRSRQSSGSSDKDLSLEGSLHIVENQFGAPISIPHKSREFLPRADQLELNIVAASLQSASSRASSTKSIFDEEIPDMVEESGLMTKKQIVHLSRSLPSRTVGHSWELVYSTSTHGISLSTLLRNCCDLDSPVLLVVQDESDKVFGAFLSDPPRVSDGFYGTGESMLFSFDHSNKLCVFRWSGENNFFIKGSKSSLAIGGGRGVFGLWLDEELYRGRSHSCDTFENATLSEREDFTCRALEAWTFV